MKAAGTLTFICSLAGGGGQRGWNLKELLVYKLISSWVRVVSSSGASANSVMDFRVDLNWIRKFRYHYSRPRLADARMTAALKFSIGSH